MLDEKQASLFRASDADFDAIHEIWMQDDVLPFLGWEKTSKELFRPIFDQIMSSSELYVLKKDSVVVAVRRIVFYTGQHEHIAELGALAVHHDHRRNGYAQLFYELLINEIRKDKKIKRIQLGQTTDNDPAHKLAQKMGFEPDVIFTDRPRRETGQEQYTKKYKWHMGARYMACTDKDCLATSIQHTTVFTPKIPNLNPDERILKNIRIDPLNDGKGAVCYYNDNKLATFTFSQWVRRFSHIQYWEVQKEPSCDTAALEACFRILLNAASKNCKKIEIYSEDKDVTDALRNLGGRYCGTRKGGCKIGEQYYDEIAVDITFFKIPHALELMKIYLKDSEKEFKISLALLYCKRSIARALSEKSIDEYGAMSLENLAYQMVRERVGEPAVRYYEQDQQPWDALIKTLPTTINKEAFEKLNATLFETEYSPSLKRNSM